MQGCRQTFSYKSDWWRTLHIRSDSSTRRQATHSFTKAKQAAGRRISRRSQLREFSAKVRQQITIQDRSDIDGFHRSAEHGGQPPTHYASCSSCEHRNMQTDMLRHRGQELACRPKGFTGQGLTIPENFLYTRTRRKGKAGLSRTISTPKALALYMRIIPICDNLLPLEIQP